MRVMRKYAIIGIVSRVVEVEEVVGEELSEGGRARVCGCSSGFE